MYQETWCFGIQESLLLLIILVCGNVSGNMVFWYTGKSLTFDKYLCVEMYQETWRFGIQESLLLLINTCVWKCIRKHGVLGYRKVSYF